MIEDRLAAVFRNSTWGGCRLATPSRGSDQVHAESESRLGSGCVKQSPDEKGEAVGIAGRRNSSRLVFILAPVVVVLLVAGLALVSCASDTASTTAPPTTAGPSTTQGVTTTQTQSTSAQAGFGGYPPGSTCADCHNDGTELTSRQAQMKQRSVHGTGAAFEEGERTACAGCHGTEGSKMRINAGLPPHDPSVAAIENVSPMGCRTCHDTHKTYTGADWSLTGDGKPVKMEYTAGTFDKGAGNLCVNCHQIRNPKPDVTGGQIEIKTARFGPHYGAQAQMLLGEGGLGGVTGSPSPHYQNVTDSCVSCHMGSEFNHTMDVGVLNANVTPNTLVRCVGCHAGLETLDRNKVQTDVQAMLDQAKAGLIKAGIMNAEDELAIPGTYPEALANAFWNYKVAVYDGSKGVHNTAYTKALLQSVIDTTKSSSPSPATSSITSSTTSST